MINLIEKMKKTKRQIKLHKRKLKVLREQRRLENIEIEKTVAALSGLVCFNCKHFEGKILQNIGHCKYPRYFPERDNKNSFTKHYDIVEIVRERGRCTYYEQKT